ALHHLATGTRPQRTGDHLADLEAELRSFRDGVSRTNSIALVGSMLTPTVDADLLATYRELLVKPRRERIRTILDAARHDGALDATPTDLDVATTMCTGSFYAFSLAGVTPPRDWPRRTARLVWRAAGGSP
ncbi:MAG: TetR-like C-terminal domain-containing protein, partial [Acidimicrobiia bacterium]